MYSFTVENPIKKYIDYHYVEELFEIPGIVFGSFYLSYKSTNYNNVFSAQDVYDSSFIKTNDCPNPAPLKLMFRFENSFNYLKRDISIGSSGSVIKEFLDVIDGGMIRECSIEDIEMALRMYTTPLGTHEENILMLRMAAYKAVKKRITGE